MHGRGEIKDLTLQMLLYHFYGYGPEEWIVDFCDEIKNRCERYGLRPNFCSNDGTQIEVELIGLRVCHSFAINLKVLQTFLPEEVKQIVEAELQTAARLANDKYPN